MIIHGRDADEVLYKVCVELQKAPEFSPRGQKTKELIKPQLVIRNPLDSIITNPARKTNLSYLNAELNWYNSGEKSIDGIKDHAKMWARIADENGEVNSNYGEIVYKQKLENFEGSQYDWVIKSLLDDKDTRQAIINFNQPKHKDPNTKDFTCTTSVQYMIRDNKLHSFTDMRSNDLIYGFTYDFPFFGLLQERVFDDIKGTYPEVKMGTNTHSATSLHVYEKHFDMVDRIVEEYERDDIKSATLESTLGWQK